MKKSLALILALVLCMTASLALADTFGLGVVTSIGSSKDASVKDGENYDGTAQVDTTICALVLGEDGLIKDIHFDVAQTKVAFSTAGLITADKEAVIKSKMEKGPEYGMLKASEIGKEWFEQVQAFEAYCIGKTVDEIVNMPTYARNESHPTCADVADLKTTCSMDIGDFLEAVAKAAANAVAR